MSKQTSKINEIYYYVVGIHYPFAILHYKVGGFTFNDDSWGFQGKRFETDIEAKVQQFTFLLKYQEKKLERANKKNYNKILSKINNYKFKISHLKEEFAEDFI